MTDSLPDSDPTPRPRGLWSLMAKSLSELSPDDQPAGSTSPPPHSLFEVMRQATSSEPSLLETPSAADPEPVRPSDDLSSDQYEDSVEVHEPISTISFFDTHGSAGPIVKARRTRGQYLGIVLGLASIGLSVLAFRPEVWMSLPASLLGFGAILIGCLRLPGSGTHPNLPATKWISFAGIVTGVMGLFLGPLYFSKLGQEWRDSSGQSVTRNHLNGIGRGLDDYHDQNGGFPVGGTFVRTAKGDWQGKHGWMTFLLPFVGEQAVYQQIDFKNPYDAKENLKPMNREIPVYYAAGGDRTRIGLGYAVSHFAGVGGAGDGGEGLSNAGLFMRERSIRRDDVTDGLANTLAVGELASSFPPWGDPENWRMIGRGLNKDINGFGNAKGTGAMFLFADGSVKFFSNKTDLKLLNQLSTRDGNENQ